MKKFISFLLVGIIIIITIVPITAKSWGNYTSTTSSTKASVPSGSQSEITEGENEYNSCGYFYKQVYANQIAIYIAEGYAASNYFGANGWTDAKNCIEHFLHSYGTTYTNISVKNLLQYNNNSSNHYTRLKSELNGIMNAMEVFAGPNTSYNIHEITQNTSNMATQGSNWIYSLNNYRTWSYFSGSRYDSPSVSYSGWVTYYIEDYYNFDKNATGFIGNALIKNMWELHYTGYAKNYFIEKPCTISLGWNMGSRCDSGASFTIY